MKSILPFVVGIALFFGCQEIKCGPIENLKSESVARIFVLSEEKLEYCHDIDSSILTLSYETSLSDSSFWHSVREIITRESFSILNRTEGVMEVETNSFMYSGSHQKILLSIQKKGNQILVKEY